jgi:hypothetical protein
VPLLSLRYLSVQFLSSRLSVSLGVFLCFKQHTVRLLWLLLYVTELWSSYSALFCCDLRRNSLANLGTMWFGPSRDLTASFCYSFHHCQLRLWDSFNGLSPFFGRGTMWFGPSRDLTASFVTPSIIVSCGLAPHRILLTDCLRSPAITFSLSRRHRFDPTTDFGCIYIPFLFSNSSLQNLPP